MSETRLFYLPDDDATGMGTVTVRPDDARDDGVSARMVPSSLRIADSYARDAGLPAVDVAAGDSEAW